MMKHTPTPWMQHRRWIGTRNHQSLIAEFRDQNGNWSDEPMALANAAFAVEAVNNHERLTQRVQELEDVLVLAEHKIDQYLQGQYPEGNSLGRILKAIRVTLAGAKESDE